MYIPCIIFFHAACRPTQFSINSIVAKIILLAYQYATNEVHVCTKSFSQYRIVSYGLLGSSGCGKTTLLRCILGRLKIEGGTITTLGKPPGTYGHPVPGRAVGYMPQVMGN